MTRDVSDHRFDWNAQHTRPSQSQKRSVAKRNKGLSTGVPVSSLGKIRGFLYDDSLVNSGRLQFLPTTQLESIHTQLKLPRARVHPQLKTTRTRLLQPDRHEDGKQSFHLMSHQRNIQQTCQRDGFRSSSKTVRVATMAGLKPLRNTLLAVVIWKNLIKFVMGSRVRTLLSSDL